MPIYDTFCDVLFLFDIYVKFNTAVYSQSKLITDRKEIIKRYCRGCFFVDLILCFPLSMLRYRSFEVHEQSSQE